MGGRRHHCQCGERFCTGDQLRVHIGRMNDRRLHRKATSPLGPEVYHEACERVWVGADRNGSVWVAYDAQVMWP